MKQNLLQVRWNFSIHIILLLLLISAAGYTQATKTAEPVASDHTLIIRHLLENVNTLKKNKAISRTSSSEEILSSLIKVTNKSSSLIGKMEFAKSRISSQNTTVVNTKLLQISEEAKKRINFKNCSSPAEYKKKLSVAIADPLYDKYPSVRVGLKTALAIFEDGENTIYSAKYYATIPGIKPLTPAQREAVAKEVAKADAEGAIGGAVAGCVATIVIGCVEGAGAGAVAGGIGASTAKAITEVFDLIFGW